MNILQIEKKTQILQLLVEGNSIRSIERIVGCSINTVIKVLEQAGVACQAYQDQVICNVKAKRVQCDEIWGFCYAKQRNVAPEQAGVLGYGDVWTWVALDADSKLAINWLIGLRTAECAEAFIGNLASRLADRIQLTTDGHGVYVNAVEKAFGGAVDYAMLVKIYEGLGTAEQCRYSPSKFVDAEKRRIKGVPDEAHIYTSHVERQNLTMGMCRFTRLTNAFSKKIESLEHAVSLHFMYYNFVRIHKSLLVTPAMAAGVSNTLWSIDDIARLIPEPVAKKRGSYKKKISN